MPNKILIMDDDPDILGLYRRYLELEGFEVFGATNGEEGLALAKSNSPDLVITDEDMPRVGGLEFLGKLRASGIMVPVIIVAGQVVHRKAELIAQGFSAVFGKPVSFPTELLPTIRSLLHEPIRSVLVINQDIPGMYGLAEILESKGVRVSVATNYGRGTDLITESVSLIVIIAGSEIELIGFLEHLSNENYQQPIIALLVNGDDLDSAKLCGYGFLAVARYVPKVNDAKMAALIIGHLAGS
ncbi:MAG: response regulator [Patescibacteria group bacterium]|nr:response regulator [Patescibacteria group bacterium]